eukprot:2857853-Lingulodinium_polyedra.AAC.1
MPMPTFGASRISFVWPAVMRASYLAQYRPDIAETVKNLARRTTSPNELGFKDLKRLGGLSREAPV